MLVAVVVSLTLAASPAAPAEPLEHGAPTASAVVTAAAARDLVEGLVGTDPTLFPASLVVVEARGAPGDVTVVLAGLPENDRSRVEHDELRRETLLGALMNAGLEGGVTFLVRRGDGSLLRLGHDPREATWPPPPRVRPPQRRAPRAPGEKPRTTARLPLGGALVGLRIAVSAGHGWLDNGDGTYRTQRSNHKFAGCGTCRGITEDFFSSETVTDELLGVLQNMGAEIILVREHDHREEEPTVIDDGDALYAEASGSWADGSTPGVGHLDDYRVNAEDDPGHVVFTVPPHERPRRVSLRWPEGQNRTPAALVTIVHEGGVRTFDIDQRRMGRLWLDLGSYSFGSGGVVELAHAPSPGFLIADAVKVGGGLHPDSRKPWWQMAAQSYVPFAGAPDTVTARSDVTIRPAYAEHVGPDAFISIHANASGAGAGSTAHGTSTYRYSCGTFGDHSSSTGATSCDDPPGSRDLLDEVHAAILGELRGAWDPGWADRGRLVADFGELRELDDTPGILIETGFFDHLAPPGGVRMSDNQALHDPRWREAFVTGVARGLARYLAPGTDAPPARPTGLVATNQRDGSLRVSWSPVDGATGYRLYKARLDSTRGRAFDEGIIVAGESVLLDSRGAGAAGEGALEPGRGYAFRVAALNEHGEGFASQAVVAGFRGRPSTAPSTLLVLWAWDRRDAWVQDRDNDLLGAVEHGRALLASPELAGLSFDGALDEAVESDALALAGYRLVDFAVGKDSTEHEPISAAMQDRLGAFLDAGGAVIASGEEIGYAMVEASADPAGAAFLVERFGAVYVADDAETFELSGVGPLAAVTDARLDDGTDSYEVVFPDVWEAAAGAELALTYPDGQGAAVVTAHSAILGAGLEAVVPEEARAQVLGGLARRLVVDLVEPAEPAEGEGEGEGEGEPSEGEGEDIDFGKSDIPPSVEPGCGCDAGGVSLGDGAGLLAVLAWLGAPRRQRTTCRATR